MEPRTDASAPLSRRGYRALCGVAMAIALTLALPALAAAAGGDNWTAPTTLNPDQFDTDTGNNASATIQTNEPLTPPPGDNLGCPFQTPFAQMVKTHWYRVQAVKTGPIHVSTFGSDFDTVLAVYATNGTPAPNAQSGTTNMLTCNDDTPSLNTSRSRMSFNAFAGQFYMIQLGLNQSSPAPPADGWDYRIVVSDTPAGNDNRQAPRTVTAGVLGNWDNFGTNEQGGEDVVCGSSSHVGSTVWFRYVMPDHGSATFTSSGFDTVMQVYRGSSTTPAACNDDQPGQTGPSQVSIRATKGTTLLVQVGGFRGLQSFFDFTTGFAIDRDYDGDGVTRPADCADLDRARRPGAPDRRGNGVDENCDGVDGQRFDRDEDGFRSNGSPRDCDDNNAGIKPGARDIPGNGIDEDCSGSDAKKPPKRKKAIRLKYNYSWNGKSKVTSLVVRPSKGVRVKVTCRGKGCPKGRSFKSNGKKKQLKRYFKKPLKRATITVTGTKKGFFGRWFKIKAKNASSWTDSDGCLKPGSRIARRKCPS